MNKTLQDLVDEGKLDQECIQNTMTYFLQTKGIYNILKLEKEDREVIYAAIIKYKNRIPQKILNALQKLPAVYQNEYSDIHKKSNKVFQKGFYNLNHSFDRVVIEYLRIHGKKPKRTAEILPTVSILAYIRRVCLGALSKGFATAPINYSHLSVYIGVSLPTVKRVMAELEYWELINKQQGRYRDTDSNVSKSVVYVSYNNYVHGKYLEAALNNHEHIKEYSSLEHKRQAHKFNISTLDYEIINQFEKEAREAVDFLLSFNSPQSYWILQKEMREYSNSIIETHEIGENDGEECIVKCF